MTTLDPGGPYTLKPKVPLVKPRPVPLLWTITTGSRLSSAQYAETLPPATRNEPPTYSLLSEAAIAYTGPFAPEPIADQLLPSH